MPRRAVTAVVATAAGLTLILSFKTPKTTVPRAAAAALGRPTPNGPTVNDQPPVTAPPATAPPRATPSTAAPSTTAPPAATGSVRTVDGPVVNTRFGDVQVEVKLSGTKITDVVALVLPSDRRRSAEISQQAGPMLRQEVLSAQSANIDTLSGATYTSEAYAQSLQAALDQARG